MSTGTPSQPLWLTHAWAELGQREIAGAASNPRIASFIRRVGHPSLARDETAWCAAFVGACLEGAGLASTRSLMARSYMKWGEPASRDEPGSVAILSRGSNSALGHVGFLIGHTERHLILLGGNQSDAVTVEAFDRNRLLALRRPPSAGLVPTKPRDTSLNYASEDAKFLWSLARILEFEGGYGEDRHDPGGPTNKGVTLETYAREIGERIGPDNLARLKAGLAAISDDLVHAIYLRRYWMPAGCPELPSALAHFHFDAAVNQGVVGATRMLQQALAVAVDGEIGPVTLAAAHAGPPSRHLERYAGIRRQRYRALPHFWRFGRGWLARVDRALAQSHDLIRAGSPQTDSPPPSKESTPMPDPTSLPPSRPVGQAAEPDPKWWGNSLTIWGAVLTAVTTVSPAVLSALGLDVPPELVQRLGRDVITLAQAAGGLVGTLMTVVGRVRARAPLERRPIALRL